MAEARITEFFGETQTDGRSVRIREEVLDFMGLGSCMPREAWRLPSPQPLQYPPPPMTSGQYFFPSLGTAAAGPRQDGPRHRSRGKGLAGMCCGEPYGEMQRVGEQDPPTRTLLGVLLSRE